MLREENEISSYIRKRETILTKRDNIVHAKSDAPVVTKKEGIPNVALKKLNRTQYVKSETKKPKTLSTESSKGQSNKAFQNIPRDKTSGVYFILQYNTINTA